MSSAHAAAASATCSEFCSAASQVAASSIISFYALLAAMRLRASLLQQRFGSLLQVLVGSAAQRVSGRRFLQRAALAARILPSDNVHGTTSRRKRSANAIGCSRARGGFTSLTHSSKLPGLQWSTDAKSRAVLAVFKRSEIRAGDVCGALSLV